MKIVLDPSLYTFDPITTGTLDFTAFAAFDQTRLLAVINTDFNGGELIYSTAGQGVTGGQFSGSVLTFLYPVVGSGMNASDNLCVLYDDPAADQVISNETTSFDSGTITGSPLNAIDNSSSGILCSPYRTAYVQMTALTGGTVRFTPEGSMNGTNWYQIPARVIGAFTTSSIISAAQTWDPADNEILAIALDCNYIRLRVASSSATSYRMRSYFTQQQYASPWAFQMLLSDGARPANYGSGTSSAQTLRVIPASDSLVNLPDLMITGPAQTATVNNALTGTASATDVSNYRSFSIQVVGTASVTGGQFTVEQSNDNTNWQNAVYYGAASTTPSPIAGANNVSSSFNQIYSGILTARYFRVRINSAITGTSASITVTARFSPISALAPIATVNGTVAVSSAQLSGTVSTDISDTLSTISTFTSSTQQLNNMGTFSVAVRVASFSGTGTPLLDVRIEESFDNASTWIPLYYYERISATGTYYSPPLRATGTHIRYVRQTFGSTISTNTIITRMIKQYAATYVKNLVDRTIAPNTLNSTTPVLMVEGCNKFQLVVSSAAGASVNPQIKLQGSEDNSNWYDITGITVTAAPSTTVVANSGTAEDLPKFVRGIVSVAGTGAVLNYVVIKAQGKP